MTDILLTLMCLAASIAFGRFVQRPSARRAVGFGVLAAGALLTKASAAWLVLVPPLTILLSRRCSLLARKEIWLSGLVAAVICGPWFAISHHLTTRGLLPNAGSSISALKQYTNVLYLANGALVLAAALIGAILVVRRSDNPVWHALAVQPFCVGLLLTFAPAQMEVRYGLMALPALVLLACYAVWRLLRRFRAEKYMYVAVTPVLGSLLLAGLPTPAPISTSLGLAMDYVASAARPTDVILMSSGGVSSEVLMVAEFASREAVRPTRTTLRANKLLAATDWNYTRYELRVDTPEAVLDVLNRASIDFIVVSSPNAVDEARPHHRLLVHSLESAPERWRMVFGQLGDPYTVYKALAE